MAARRKRPSPKRAGRAARPRDYAAEYRRRQERARSLGFRNYYERRTRPAPGAPKPSKETLARLRGHAGRAAFIAWIRPGNVVMLDRHISKITVDGRGRFGPIGKRVIDEERGDREFVIRNQTLASLKRLVADEIAAGAIMTPVPSFDQSRLLGGQDRLEAIYLGELAREGETP
jgi:hypothetical protein